MMAALRFKSVVVVLAMTIDVNETSSRKESRGGEIEIEDRYGDI